MPASSTPSIETLKKALGIAEQIQKLETELVAVLNHDARPTTTAAPDAAKARRKKRVVSAESRAKMAAAQRARWAKKKAQ